MTKLAAFLDADPTLDQTVLADVVGARLHARRIYQRRKGLSPGLACREHALGVQIGGGAGAERHEGGRRTGRTDRVRSAGLLRAGVPSQWLLPEEGVDVLHLCIDEARFRQLAEMEGHDPDKVELVERMGVEDRFLFSLVPAILAEISAPTPSSPLMIDGFEMIVVGHMLRAYSTRGMAQEALEARDAARREDVAVTRAQALMLERMAEAMPFDEVAAAVGLPPFVLRRHFTRRVGLPPHTWLTERRLSRARDLLAGPMPLAQVAVECGFCSQSHMTETFRRHLGLTPGAFRRARQ